MAKAKKVHIIGAGLSGMVAAINLAREGHRVIVLDGAKKIGGIHPHHPSNHSTPMNLDLIKNYVGIDITPCITPSKSVYIYADSHKYKVPGGTHGYSVERGFRKRAMDMLLYKEALELGVEFEFNREIKDPFDMPDPTIIATGLFQHMQEVLGRPMVRMTGFSARRKITDPKRQGEIRLWFGSYTNAYGYAPIMNDLDYVLLLSDQDLDLLDLKIYEEELEKSEGLRFSHWDYNEAVVPVGHPDAPKLFAGSKILAGTLSGMMEPGLYFGIHGALVSGKVAARAVSDPEGAARDFQYFNRGFKQSYYLKRMMDRNPFKHHFMKFSLRFPALFMPFNNLSDTGIPGIDHFGTADVLPEYMGRY